MRFLIEKGFFSKALIFPQRVQQEADIVEVVPISALRQYFSDEKYIQTSIAN
jgi:hypothetical protein